jgi:hypothetical protein
MTDRVALSKRIRFEVFKRDRFCCQYCGRHPPDVVLEVDHIVPVCDGGDSSEGNLLAACFDCNRGKAGTSLTIIPKDWAQQAAEITEKEEQLAGYREVFRQQQDRIEADMWEIAEILQPGSSRDGMRRDWLSQIKRFNERLGLAEVIDAAEIAYSKQSFQLQEEYLSKKHARFRYFCGICWRKIKAREEGLDGDPT